MGKYSKGILGSFNGKVGTVIGSTWNGIDYMKSLPKKSSKAPSVKQMIQRDKFALATGFLQPISALVSLGFKNGLSGQTGFNAATSYVLANAITGDHPDFGIDYSKVLISKGALSIPSNVQISSTIAGQIQFIWADNSSSGLAAATDKAILLVINPETLQAQSTTEGAERSSTGQVWDVIDFQGQEVHVWIAFISADGKTLSSSVYAGSLTVAEAD